MAICVEREEIIQQKFADIDLKKGDGIEMLVSGNMTWYVEPKAQFQAVTDTALYINQSFHQVKEEFLSVIDHLETEEDEEKVKEREIHNDKVREELKIAYSTLSPESLQTLNKIVERVKENYPSIQETLRRTKRFGIMSWVLGWGVYSNYRQISTLKRNVQILHQQNLLQEK